MQNGEEFRISGLWFFYPRVIDCMHAWWERMSDTILNILRVEGEMVVHLHEHGWHAAVATFDTQRKKRTEKEAM